MFTYRCYGVIAYELGEKINIIKYTICCTYSLSMLCYTPLLSDNKLVFHRIVAILDSSYKQKNVIIKKILTKEFIECRKYVQNSALYSIKI